MKRMLGIDDVVLQVVFTAVVHWLASPEWKTTAFFERAGAVIPIALISVALWRVWRERPAT